MRSSFRSAAVTAALLLLAIVAGCGGHGGSLIPRILGSPPPVDGPAWYSFGGDAVHGALALIQPQPLTRIRWSTPVDLHPEESGGNLYIHYGSPVITSRNTVIVPVKTGAYGGFRIEAHVGFNGALLWKAATDYTLPAVPAGIWTPSYNATLTFQNVLVFPGAGGRIYERSDPDAKTGTQSTAVFYGASNYAADPSAYDAHVQIDTPITADAQGDLYFGFVVTGSTPLGLQSGIARIGADGVGSWVAASAAAGDGAVQEVVTNSAPAMSLAGSTLYVAVSSVGNQGFSTDGYLLALNSTTLATTGKVLLLDPESTEPADVPSSGTASPTIGPDGDVYFGVLENGDNHDCRGWLLHYDSTLSQTKTPGSFGWDDTASLVPSSSIPSYAGASTYLLMTKYNFYADPGCNGTGNNEIAVIDPTATEADPIDGTTMVMKEIVTHAGVTPDGEFSGVKEWCINSAAVTPANDSVYAPSEDGYLYHWSLPDDSFPERLRLTSGIGEAYTPTAIGADGTVYAISDSILFAVGE